MSISFLVENIKKKKKIVISLKHLWISTIDQQKRKEKRTRISFSISFYSTLKAISAISSLDFLHASANGCGQWLFVIFIQIQYHFFSILINNNDATKKLSFFTFYRCCYYVFCHRFSFCSYADRFSFQLNLCGKIHSSYNKINIEQRKQIRLCIIFVFFFFFFFLLYFNIIPALSCSIPVAHVIWLRLVSVAKEIYVVIDDFTNTSSR